LFKNVVAHHCLGAVWSRRADRKHPIQPVSVLATVDQFNAISFRVIATILKSPLVMPDERAEVIEKWIDVAQVLTKSLSLCFCNYWTACTEIDPFVRFFKLISFVFLIFFLFINLTVFFHARDSACYCQFLIV